MLKAIIILLANTITIYLCNGKLLKYYKEIIIIVL